MMTETRQIIDCKCPMVEFSDTYRVRRELEEAGLIIDTSGKTRRYLRHIKYFVNHGPCPLTGGKDRVYLCELIPGLVTAKMTAKSGTG